MSEADGESVYVYVAARQLGISTAELRQRVAEWGLGWDVAHHLRRLSATQVAELGRRLGGGVLVAGGGVPISGGRGQSERRPGKGPAPDAESFEPAASEDLGPPVEPVDPVDRDEPADLDDLDTPEEPEGREADGDSDGDAPADGALLDAERAVHAAHAALVTAEERVLRAARRLARALKRLAQARGVLDCAKGRRQRRSATAEVLDHEGRVDRRARRLRVADRGRRLARRALKRAAQRLRETVE